MLASQCSPRSGGVAATDASRVRLPSSEGLFFASRARHAAAARLPRIPSSYIGAWGSVWAEQQRRKRAALRSAPMFGFSRTRLGTINLHGLMQRLGVGRRRVIVWRVRPPEHSGSPRRRAAAERRRQTKRPWHRRFVREKLQRQGSEPRMIISGRKISIVVARPTALHHIVYFRKRRQRGPHAICECQRRGPLDAKNADRAHVRDCAHVLAPRRNKFTAVDGSTLIMLLIGAFRKSRASSGGLVVRKIRFDTLVYQ